MSKINAPKISDTAYYKVIELAEKIELARDTFLYDPHPIGDYIPSKEAIQDLGDIIKSLHRAEEKLRSFKM